MTGLTGLSVALRVRVRRPAGMVESVRWLFAGLPLLTIALTLPAPVLAGRGLVLVMALIAASVLIASCTYTYLSQRAVFGLDVLDAAALTAFALACSDPFPATGIAFACLWFRALYGTTARSVLRCGLYVLALTVPLWTVLPGHTDLPAVASLFGTFPIMFLMAIVARRLAESLLTREQNLRRDAALASTGAHLLGMTDAAKIRALEWAALTAICAATTGLRIVKMERDGAVLRLLGAIGSFHAAPAIIPGRAIASAAHEADDHVSDTAALDAAVGAQLDWACVSLADHHEDAWLVLGCPKKVSAEAILAVQSLVNQVTLALSNSDVHAELQVQARVDSLTALANRAAFTTGLSVDLERRAGADAGDDLHVLFLDLDDFKHVNDKLGHRAGDELLAEVAARIRHCTRAEDLCARLGGDEFAIVLHGTTPMTAVEIAQRIVDAIAEPIHLNRRTARVGVSIGIAAATAGIDLEGLVHQADVAMYAAKARGKGRIQVFNPALLRVDTFQPPGERRQARTAGELLAVSSGRPEKIAEAC